MPFTPKKKDEEKDFTIAISQGKRDKAGQVGVEIEVEGHGVFIEKAIPGWTVHADGSLRGAENCEYVFTKPMNFDTAKGKVKALFDQFEAQKTKLDESNRTSVHVHLNVLPFYMNRVTALMALWFIHEEILTQWCGDHRTGNLFCLRAKDADAIINDLRYFIKTGVPPRDGAHYAAMNGDAIRKYGSLEIRTMRGSSDPKPIIQWIEILQRLYDASADYKDPRTICEVFSMNGPVHFFYELFGPTLSKVIRDGVQFTDDEFRESLYEGIRFAQRLCFARDWSKFNPTEIKQDVFGRKEDVAVEMNRDIDELAALQRAREAMQREVPRMVRRNPRNRAVERVEDLPRMGNNRVIWDDPWIAANMPWARHLGPDEEI